MSTILVPMNVIAVKVTTLQILQIATVFTFFQLKFSDFTSGEDQR